MDISVIWIRNDLRFHDNTALIQAVNDVQEGDRLMLVFYLDPKQFKIGSWSHDYFFASLNTFYKACQDQNIDMYFLYGELLPCFSKLLYDFEGIKRVYFNKDESGYGERRDQDLRDFLNEKNIEVFAYSDHHIHSAKQVLKSDDSHYKVFTPYYHQWIEKFKNPQQSLDHDKLRKLIWNDFEGKDSLAKDQFDQLINSFNRDLSPLTGEEKARKFLKDFAKTSLSTYDKNRDYPAVEGTSRLSCFLSTGQISIREVYSLIEKAPPSTGKEVFIKELAWRDFYNMIYHFYPKQQDEEIIEKYRNLPWSYDEEAFAKWKEGQTGFPIVDAAMRQLKEEGWMHNRLRMIAASFLVKDLLMDWRMGEEYFSRMLIDYDSASNIGGWQWAASVGTDAAPYFRVFNPTTQGQKFDPDGEFIKKYVKELKDVPKEYIHEPHRYAKQLKSQWDIEIDSVYPKAMVDHKTQRLRAIEMFQI